MVEHHDLIVIGGGSGGIAAVDAALRRGVRPLLVQDGAVGGDCTFTGCVPSKTLIAAAARGATPADALATVRRVVGTVAATEDADTFRRRGATVVEGRARFVTRDVVEVDGRRFQAPRVVIATGAVPIVPPIDGLASTAPLTSATLWDLDDLPASVAVLGGGAIGVELAQALARLGCAVVLLEAEDRILGGEEPDSSAVVRAVLEADGVDVRTGAMVGSVAVQGGRSMLRTGGGVVTVDAVLVATGRRPVTHGLGLDHAGVRLDPSGHVVTDASMATTAPGVYAVGDVTGRFPFTHGAHAQGLVAVGNALGPVPLRRFSARAIPMVVYTDPEVARVGMTEADAYGRWGAAARVVELPMSAVDRAVTEDRTEGFVKLVTVPGRLFGDRLGGRLVGATIVAPRAGEMVHELALAMRLRIPPAALATTTHAYPTWGLAVQQAASGLFLQLERGSVRPAAATG